LTYIKKRKAPTFKIAFKFGKMVMEREEKMVMDHLLFPLHFTECKCNIEGKSLVNDDSE
jgi:hypothetical protein